MNARRTILFFNTMFDEPLRYLEAALPEGFEISTDRRRMGDAAAVVFHLPSLHSRLFRAAARRLPALNPLSLRSMHRRKTPGQLWVAWFMECEANHPQLRDSAFMGMFDLTMSYRSDADVVVRYCDRDLERQLRSPVRPKGEGNLVCAFISSSIHGSGRLEYLRELMRQVDVHSYGRVLHNRTLADDRGVRSKIETMARYPFSIAFENAVAADYVTEKLYHPLVAGSVPVYLGAPNVGDFAPGDGCFVDVADFEGPAAVARRLLSVATDDAAYGRCLAWKTQPYRPAFLRLLEAQTEHPFVRLCRKVAEMSGGRAAPGSTPAR